MLSRSNDDTITGIGLKGSEECPKGQVPIHKPKTNLTTNLIHIQEYTRTGKKLLAFRFLILVNFDGNILNIKIYYLIFLLSFLSQLAGNM